MLYGIISFFKSLIIWGLISTTVYTLLIYIQDISFMNNIHILMFLYTVVFIERLYFYIRYWKYIILPYSLNLHNNFKDDRAQRDLFLDRFVSIRKIRSKKVLERILCKDLDRFELEYKNFVAIDIDNYKQHTEQILHFLGLIEKRYEVKVYHKKDKNIVLSFYKLPKLYKVDRSPFKPNKLFLGMNEKGLFYRNLETIDHHLVVGSSGSGKSNFMQMLNINFLFNLCSIKKMYMVDLKGGVELKRFEKIEKVQFVSDIYKLNSFLDTVIEDLKTTQEEMLRINTRKIKELTLLIFDEIGAISVYPDKKLREEIFNKLALIAMQGRSSSIFLFLFAQKMDASVLPSSIINNINSRVLLSTSSDYNINLIDLKDKIRENITWVEVQDFNKGRAIYKNGITSEKTLVQFPFISDEFLNSIISLDMENISSDLLRRKAL